MYSGYQDPSLEVYRQHWLDMVGLLTMSACAGQRTSGEGSGWVWWSSSRTDWNHGHGCSHGIGASQPKQQGSTVQLLNIISSPVPLSACGAQLGCRVAAARSWMGTRAHVRTVSPGSPPPCLSNPEPRRVPPRSNFHAHTLGRTP